jgi:hypothetical protein
MLVETQAMAYKRESRRDPTEFPPPSDPSALLSWLAAREMSASPKPISLDPVPESFRRDEQPMPSGSDSSNPPPTVGICSRLPQQFSESFFESYIRETRASLHPAELPPAEHHPGEPPPIPLDYFYGLMSDVPPEETALELPPRVDDTYLPSLSELLSRDFTPMTLRAILAFLTVSVPSSDDWRSLEESNFFANITSILAGQDDEEMPLVVACLHRVFSPARSEGPPHGIVSVLASMTDFIVPVLPAVAHHAKDLAEFVALGADLMLLLPDPEFSDTIMDALAQPVISHIYESVLTQIHPQIWEMMRAWPRWSCQPDSNPVIKGIQTALVSKLDCLIPGDVVHLSDDFICVMTDACAASSQLRAAVAQTAFPPFVYNQLIASADEATVLASLPFLTTLLPALTDLSWISPGWIDPLADEWPEHAELVFAFGIHAITRPKAYSDAWWAYAHPKDDDRVDKKYFSTYCFGYWIAHGDIGLPDYAVFVPILADFIYLFEEDPTLTSKARRVLLAYVSTNEAEILECICYHLQDGEIGEELRSHEEVGEDLVIALDTVLAIPPEDEANETSGREEGEDDESQNE